MVDGNLSSTDEFKPTRVIASYESGWRAVRLRTLVTIRWVAVAGQTAALLVIYFGFGLNLPIAACLAVISISGAVNLLIHMRHDRLRRIKEQSATLYLAFDIIQLSALLYLTGGLENPFSVLILAPIMVSATILSTASTVMLSLFAVACSSVLALWHLPLPWSDTGYALEPVYKLGLWAAITIATAFITAYVWLVAEDARRLSQAFQESQLSLAREQRMSALGALAASAAHELSSPLGTIAVIAREIEHDLPRGSPLEEDANLLRSEIERCRQILARLSERPADREYAGPLPRVPLSALVENAVGGCAHHGIDVIIEPHGPAGPRLALPLADDPEAVDADLLTDPEPAVRETAELQHGLATLIQNAVQFAQQTVEITVYWDSHGFAVIIEDDGPGFAQAILDRLGEPFVSTRRGRAGHMGLGIFIAQNLLVQTGASTHFGNRDEGGGRVAVKWITEHNQGTDDAVEPQGGSHSG